MPLIPKAQNPNEAKTIEDAGNNQIIILHCVATYPPEDSDVNLNNIKTLMSTYPDYPIGFSDQIIYLDLKKNDTF